MISLIAILLYLVSGVLLVFRLGKGSSASVAGKGAILALAGGAIILHAALLHQRLLIENGINLGFFNAASLIGWLVALLLVLSALTKPVENLGIALLPLAMVQALLLAIQDHHLRNRQPGGFVRALPPLKTMETLLFQMIGAGFALLTLSLVTGILFLEDILAQHLVHKTVLSFVAWVIFAVLLWGRWRFGWRGRKAIRWTQTGARARIAGRCLTPNPAPLTHTPQSR